jgi:hypothetical protein
VPVSFPGADGGVARALRHSSLSCFLRKPPGGSGHDVFGELRRRSAVHHRVGVLDTHAVRAKMVFHDAYDRVIGVALCPIALSLEHHGERSDRLRTRLDHPLHRVVMR